MAIVVAVGFVSLWRGDSSMSIVPGTSWARGSWAYDVEDDRLLVGFADNVFFGQVQSGTPAAPAPLSEDSPEDGFPQTAYSVLPMGNIQGELMAPLTVIQLGGTKDGTLMLFEGDSLLNVGDTYLLLTRAHRPQPGEDDPGAVSTHYLIAPGYDHPSASTPAQAAELTTRFSAAYAEEDDPSEPDPSSAPSTQATSTP